MEDLRNRIADAIRESVEVKQKLSGDNELQDILFVLAGKMADCLRGGGKVLFCGNGGSAADAQHLAAELSGRFYSDREPLYAEALHVNTSYLTAVANDYSYEEIYSRLVKAKGREGDILIGISTSGNSPNILRAVETGNRLGMITAGMTGESGGKMQGLCNYMVRIPSKDTPRIQECHILCGHILCELVEKILFPSA
jgi:D-sedoheptulose 7-phosphate isomerase